MVSAISLRRMHAGMVWGRPGRQFFIFLLVMTFLCSYLGFFDHFESSQERKPLQLIDDRIKKFLMITEQNPVDQLPAEIKKEEVPPGPETLHANEAQHKEPEIDFNTRIKTRSDKLKDHLQNICNNFEIHLPLTAFMLAHMHFDHKHKAVYCFTPKVACTSWKRIWMKLTGMVPPDKDLSEIRRYTLHSAIPSLASARDINVTDILATYKTFMFVRHPFDRVLSAFKDKLEHTDKESSYNFKKEIGIRIQNKYRRPGPNYTGEGVTFSEFIKFISEPGHGTFEQRNEHWLSVHDICNPCRVKYDFIGKYENLKEDAHYVLQWLGASDMISDFPVSDRPFHATRYDPKYFDQLDHKTKLAFFQKFLSDFSAFDYTFE